MAFVNEVVSDEDIDRYGLPFKKGSGRYWTRDAERDFYLWGGSQGNPAIEDCIEWRFHLFLYSREIIFSLSRGRGSKKFSESPYVICWDSIKRVSADGLEAVGENAAIEILKEALIVYGEGGQDNKYTPRREIRFNF